MEAKYHFLFSKEVAHTSNTGCMAEKYHSLFSKVSSEADTTDCIPVALMPQKLFLSNMSMASDCSDDLKPAPWPRRASANSLSDDLNKHQVRSWTVDSLPPSQKSTAESLPPSSQWMHNASQFSSASEDEDEAITQVMAKKRAAKNLEAQEPCVEPVSQDLKEKWLKRREERKRKTMAEGRMTYGAYVQKVALWKSVDPMQKRALPELVHDCSIRKSSGSHQSTP